MNTSLILLIILFVLMMVIGGRRGVKSFFTLVFNFLILFIMLIVISSGFEPIKVTIIFSVLITIITLFYVNGVNAKTVSSLLSVTIVILLTLLMTYKIGTNAKIQGFGKEQAETIAFVSVYVQLNFTKVLLCEVLIGLLGAIIDVSISISSSLYEIHKSDPAITKQNLFHYGMNIGKDILGTMTNTLLFAYIGGFMTLIIYFNELHYSILNIVNAKVFCSEVFQSLCGGIGIILIIPVTSFITSEILFSKHLLKLNYIKKSY
ncbi:YibE/F family protein [Clostridium aciditolerans]|uniref:YibE/F family protein n=1 Tax=Clostridium aciditolerans TaxID=339861 RepID=A0A934I2K3_9CLOT|nr:YibE/F family protein [Clostridium aciditolerans]MBI6875662.1 YibE/F family protein [Clostridium aciditolerans]